MPFAATWLDLEIIILSEVREKDKHHITYMQNLKNVTNELIYKTEIGLQTLKTNFMATKGKRGRINYKLQMKKMHYYV